MGNFIVRQFTTTLELEQFLNELSESDVVVAVTETAENFTVIVHKNPALAEALLTKYVHSLGPR